MKNVFQILIITLSVLFIFLSCSNDETRYPDFVKEGTYSGSYYPTSTWRECSPEEVGMNADKLKPVYEYCANKKRNTFSFLIIKDGYIVAEHYFNQYKIGSKLPSYSLAKSFVSALTGVAIQNNYISGVDDKIINYIPQLQNIQTDKKEITIKHLLTMTSGFEWNENEISMSSNDIYNIRSSSNYIQYVLDKPIVETPGTVWNYSSGMPLLLGYIIENATGMLTSEFAKQTLFKDLGIADFDWDTVPEGHTNGAWGLSLKTRDYAKLGFLYWENGLWDNKEVLPDYWVTDSRKPALIDAQQYGYLWWTAYRYADHIETQVPVDTYMAVGLFQKYIIVIPSYNLILVRIGDDLMEGENGWDSAQFISLVIEAIDNP